jgi:hypothetical protein
MNLLRVLIFLSVIILFGEFSYSEELGRLPPENPTSPQSNLVNSATPTMGYATLAPGVSCGTLVENGKVISSGCSPNVPTTHPVGPSTTTLQTDNANPSRPQNAQVNTATPVSGTTPVRGYIIPTLTTPGVLAQPTTPGTPAKWIPKLSPSTPSYIIPSIPATPATVAAKPPKRNPNGDFVAVRDGFSSSGAVKGLSSRAPASENESVSKRAMAK